MDSKALYYTIPYARTFSSHLVGVVDYQGRPAAILEKTLFYPEGGGQPGDRGWLEEHAVLDTVRREDGAILHILESRPAWTAGDTIALKLDWEHRYTYMRMHTAQHIISGLAFKLFGIGTLSVHQGEEGLTIETDRSDIPHETLMALEEAANRAIRADIPVVSRELPHDEAEALGMRRSIKVDGDVRIVHIQGIDTMACGGVHVASTGEVDAVRFAGAETVRSHMRMFWLSGTAVYETERQARAVCAELSTLLSAPHDGIVLAVKETQAALHGMRRQAALACEASARDRLQLLMLQSPIRYKGIPVVLWELEEDGLLTSRHMGAALTQCEAVVLCAVQPDRDKLAWTVGLKGVDLPFEQVREKVLGPLGAAGGGKSPLWQGVARNMAPHVFLEAFRQMVEGK